MKMLAVKTGRSLIIMMAILLAGIVMTIAPASAAVSLDQCNQTSDVAACKQAFRKCDDNAKKSDPDLCKNIYLNQHAQLDAQKAPPESNCDATSNPAACKKAYEKCGNNDNTCKQKTISDQTLPDVNNAPVTGHFSTGDNQYKTIRDVCGSGDDAVGLSIKIGCKGQGNPIADMLFAIIRIASDGVGLVVIGSIIYGGIQYTGSRGDPQSTAMAVNRIRSSIFALLIFIFGYAILNFIIPANFL